MSESVLGCAEGHGEGGHEENMNLKGAVLHVIGDLVQSLGVAVAGALIWWNQVRSPDCHASCDCS